MSDLKTARWIKENVEAIAVAVVMALVIRQFAVEAFKIPTESMWPTLMGDENGHGSGDRILVDKIPYIFGTPSRWDVVVFKFPLNESKNYIKRLVGLPGETLEITHDGDVLIDGKIARKPPHVQEVLFFPVEAADTADGGGSNWVFPGEGWSRGKDGEFSVRSPAGESLCEYTREIVSKSNGMDVVGDVRIRLEVTPEDGGEVILRIREHAIDHRLVLAVGSGESYAARGDRRFPLPGIVLEPGVAVDVSFTNVDDTLAGKVDGESFSFLLDGPHVERPRGDERPVAFGVRGGAATFRDIGVDRDIYYTRDGDPYRWEIPRDRFFMLGDNSGTSKDSRKWWFKVYTLTDGTVLKTDWDGRIDPEDRVTEPPRRQGYEKILDNHGIWRVFPTSAIAETRRERAPFVRRDKLIGKAFFVFWPLNVFKDQFRLKFIR